MKFNLIWNGFFLGFAVTTMWWRFSDGQVGWGLLQLLFVFVFAFLLWLNHKQWEREGYQSRLDHKMDKLAADIKASFASREKL